MCGGSFVGRPFLWPPHCRPVAGAASPTPRLSAASLLPQLRQRIFQPDTQALIRGILSGKIGAAGLDVYDEEGPNVYQNRSGEIVDSVTSRLCSFPNVVMTSHQAFFTKEALGEIARVTLDNARALANGTDFVDRSVVC